jgi:23S rRNA (guanosine2251-2'-O)-methyltransferase
MRKGNNRPQGRSGKGGPKGRSGGRAVFARPARNNEEEREQREQRTRTRAPREQEREHIPYTTSSDEQVEGRHPVLEALKSERTINKILLADGVHATRASWCRPCRKPSSTKCPKAATTKA